LTVQQQGPNRQCNPQTFYVQFIGALMFQLNCAVFMAIRHCRGLLSPQNSKGKHHTLLNIKNNTCFLTHVFGDTPPVKKNFFKKKFLGDERQERSIKGTARMILPRPNSKTVVLRTRRHTYTVQRFR
jgi:hypothetical protein